MSEMLTPAEWRHLRNASHDELSIAYETLLGQDESLRSLARRGLLRFTIANTAVITEAGRDVVRAIREATDVRPGYERAATAAREDGLRLDGRK